MALTIQIPSFSLSGTDTRHGDGLIIQDKNNNVLVMDGFDGSSPSAKIISILKSSNFKDINLFLSHPHYDHYKGLTMIMQDSFFSVKTLYCYDPETIKHGIGTSSNGKAVKEDYDNFIKTLNLAKSKNIAIKYLAKGDTVTIGDIYFKVWRKQPTSFTADDNGQGYAFINDGSLCCYFPRLQFLTTGDGPQNIKQAISYFGGKVVFIKVPHHGNNCSQSNAAAVYSAGCRLAYETNIQKNGPGTTDFTLYGTRRLKQAGITVLMSNYDITVTAAAKKLTIKQNGKSWTYDVPFEDGTAPVENGWIYTEDQKWKYRKSDGSFVIGWAQLDWSKGKNWFYFDKDGYMFTGWLKDNNTWYYLNPETGVMELGKWLKLPWSDGTDWFYFDGYGRCIINQAYAIDGKWYYFNARGARITGWFEDPNDHIKRYLDPIDGHMVISQVIDYEGKKYYVDGYGRLVTNAPYQVDGKWYYADQNGERLTGWLPLEDGVRYLDPKTGQMIKNDWLVFTYYVDGYGRRVENQTIEIDGQKYTFDKDGILINTENENKEEEKESDKEFKIFFINHERFTTSSNWGDNCLIESDGKFILMDTCMPNGEDAILKFLKTRGVNKLSLYISHAHMDHYGNAMALLKDSYFTIEHLYMNKYGQISNIDNSNVQMHYGNMKKIGEYAKGKGIPITWLQKGAKWDIGSAHFEILYDAPMNISSLGEGGRDLLNNLSPVCMVTLGNVKYLTCGDAQVAVENTVLNAGIDVKADIWKMQHHGGNEANSLNWVKAISPKYAVYNNGQTSIGNTSWTKGAVQNAHSVGAKVYNPTYHGNIIFTIKGKDIQVWSERNTDKY